MTPATPAFLQALRAATAETHRALETLTDSRRFFAGDADKQHYATFLQSHLALHERVAAQAAATQREYPELHILDWPQCGRIAALRLDLERIDQTPAHDIDTAPPARTQGYCLGITYVAEGSCMGNQRLHAALSKVEDFNAWRADAFFQSCGAGFADRWRQFIAVMTVHAPGQQAEIEAGALDGFAQFRASWVAASGETTAT